MSLKRSDAAMAVYQERFIDGAVARGVARHLAERVFEQVRAFSGFGFPKAHAAAFGLLAYQSTWLRVHYAPEFLCALLNEQPMGFYPPDALVHDAQRRGIEVLPPHVNRSAVECRVEQRAVRIGLGYVLGVQEHEVKALVAERERAGDFADAGDLAARSGAGRDTLERLAWAGALNIGASPQRRLRRRTLPRREALWQMGVVTPGRAVEGGVQLALPIEAPAAPALRELTRWERLVADYGSIRISLAEHPLALLRPELPQEAVPSTALQHIRHGRRVMVAGLVVARQRPATANGVTFMLLEDEWGTINLVVTPPVFERHRLIVRTEPFVLVEGRLERRAGVINVVVDSLRALEQPDLPRAEVKQIEPPAERETGRPQEQLAAVAGELRSVLPSPHSFGRRAP
jgi:error-prone DNA polymerase